MPHKIVEKEAVDRLNSYIQYCNDSIDKVKVVSRERNNEGVKIALEMIRDLKIECEANKSRVLQKPSPMNFVKAHGFEQKEQAYMKILDMFENPKQAVGFYRSEITRVTEQLELWKNAEKR